MVVERAKAPQIENLGRSKRSKQAELSNEVSVSLLVGGKIVRIQFVSPKVQACLVRGDARGTAAEVRVEYLLPCFCVVCENPVVQGDGLLGGMDATSIVALIWELLEFFCRTFERRPSHFVLRKGHGLGNFLSQSNQHGDGGRCCVM